MSVGDTANQEKLELIDLLSQVSLGQWVFAFGGFGAVEVSRLVLERRGEPYVRLASFVLPFRAGHEHRLVILVDYLSHSVDVAMDGKTLTKLKQPGRHVLSFTPAGTVGRLSLAPADSPDATVIITQLRLLAAP